MKFSIKDFFSKCDQIDMNLRIWSHLLKKSLLENFIFCAVNVIYDLLIGFKQNRYEIKPTFEHFKLALKFFTLPLVFRINLRSNIFSFFNRNHVICILKPNHIPVQWSVYYLCDFVIRDIKIAMYLESLWKIDFNLISDFLSKGNKTWVLTINNKVVTYLDL